MVIGWKETTTKPKKNSKLALPEDSKTTVEKGNVEEKVQYDITI